MRNSYLDEFRGVARSAFAMWNRDPASPSFGSFDRPYWGWKYKDFSDATLQYAVRLAVNYAQDQGKTAVLPSLLEAYVHYCAKLQRKDGSFDQCYPYEATPGVVYDFLSTLIFVRQSPYLASSPALATLDSIINKALTFVLNTDEKHGEVANHLAQYAYELLVCADHLGHEGARRQAEAYLERMFAQFEQSEGWFLEYSGPDAGYQTRMLRYLVKIAGLLQREDIWDAAKRSARFVEELMMPDGSLHPMLGVRSTSLLYPSAFEMLAAHDEEFLPLALRVRGAWELKKVPMPADLDFGNAIRLADDAWDASQTPAPPSSVGQPQIKLPTHDTHFQRAGILIRRRPDYVAYVGYALGGVVILWTREADGTWKLAAEDSGYLLKSEKGSWLTRMPGAGSLIECSESVIRFRSHFYRSLHDELTPSRMILLRTLNLTVLRVQWLADLFRKLIVHRLMGNIIPLPLQLERTVNLEQTRIEIRDNIAATAPLNRELSGHLYRCRRITGLHMASSRYFQPVELEDIAPGWMQPVPGNISAGINDSLFVALTHANQ